MDNLITAIYLFKQLPDDVKKLNKIKVGASTPRYDIVGENADGYNFMEPLFNNKNQCNLSLLSADNFVQADTNRIADLALRNSRVGNLTSLYYQQVDNKGRYFGTTNPNRLINKGKDANPMLPFKDDLLLIEISADKSTLTIAVLKGQKYFAQYLYPAFVDGKFDEIIKSKLLHLESDYGYLL